MTSPEQVPTPTTITPITFPAGQETRTKILSGLRQGQDVILKSSTSGEVCLSSVAKDSATDYFTLSGSECDLPEGFAIRLSGSSLRTYFLRDEEAPAISLTLSNNGLFHLARKDLRGFSQTGSYRVENLLHAR